MIPVFALAEGEGDGEPGGEVTTEIVEPTAVPTVPPPPPTAVPTIPPPPPPPPTAVPTQVPPTAVPPTAVPTVAPPTATVAPTATAEPTPSPTPEPTPSPTEVVWINTDSMTVVDGAGSHSMKPGDGETVMIRYQVTTPRASTVIHAELSGDVQGWNLSSPALGDADAAATKAVWTQGGAVTPGTTFDLPIVVMAPANVAADQGVELRIWSVANTERGAESGVAKPVGPNAGFTVIAPPPPTEVPVVASVSDASEAEEVVVSDEGHVQDSTPVANATPAADPEVAPDDEVIDEDEGDSPEAGGVDVVASPVASPTAESEDSNAGEVDGEVEGQDVDVESGPVGSSHVRLAVERSLEKLAHESVTDEEQALEAGDLDAVASPKASPVAEGQDVPDVAAVASPQASPVAEIPSDEPTIDCEVAGENVFTCAIDAGQQDVRDGVLSISGASDWGYLVNGTPVSASGEVDLAVLDVDLNAPATLDIAATYPEGCADPDAEHRAQVAVSYGYADGSSARENTAISMNAPTSGPTLPTLSMQPLDFGTLTWNGSSWGSSEVTGRISVSQDGCGQPGPASIQIETLGATPGMHLTITSVSVTKEGLVAVGNVGDPTAGPVTVAMTEPGFTGDAEVVVTYRLTPSDEIGTGEYEMTIRAKARSDP